MENINVALRVRPLNQQEVEHGEEGIWNVFNADCISLSPLLARDPGTARKLGQSAKISFTFDKCFDGHSSNSSIYESVVKRIVLSSLNGINGTIFMYGQTGSGKTFTMMGTEYQLNHKSATIPRPMDIPELGDHQSLSKHRQKSLIDVPYEENSHISQDTNGGNYSGILIMALKDLFSRIQGDQDKAYFIRCSYVEIYNDFVYDLLKPNEELMETLTVNEDAKKDFYIKGVTEESVSSLDEILEILRRGENNRHYAETAMNHSSSRSHTIFRVSVQSVTNSYIRKYRHESATYTNINNPEIKSSLGGEFISNIISSPQGTMVTESLLNFVDLAGSERVSTQNSDEVLNTSGFQQSSQDVLNINNRELVAQSLRQRERQKEGQHINKSLFFLTQVISLKSEGKSHIPYRNSPLTKILRSSLGGNSRTLIILCLTPTISQMEQSLSTCRFGLNAKKIENRVQANIITNKDDEALKILLCDYEKKVRDLENYRNENKMRTEILTRQIEDLTQQKVALNEKLKLQNKRNFLHIMEVTSSGIPLSRNESTNSKKHSVQYLDAVGLLISSGEVARRPHSPSSPPSQRQKSPPPQHPIPQHPRFKENTNASQSLALENSLLYQKIRIFEDNSKALNRKYGELLDNHLNLFFKNEKALNLLSTLSKKAKSLQEQCEMLREQAKQSEAAGIKVNEISDDEIEAREKAATNELDRLKEEKARRKYCKEIDELKTKLGLPTLKAEVPEQGIQIKAAPQLPTTSDSSIEKLIEILIQNETSAQDERVFCKLDIDTLRQVNDLDAFAATKRTMIEKAIRGNLDLLNTSLDEIDNQLGELATRRFTNPTRKSISPSPNNRRYHRRHSSTGTQQKLEPQRGGFEKSSRTSHATNQKLNSNEEFSCSFYVGNPLNYALKPPATITSRTSRGSVDTVVNGRRSGSLEGKRSSAERMNRNASPLAPANTKTPGTQRSTKPRNEPLLMTSRTVQPSVTPDRLQRIEREESGKQTSKAKGPVVQRVRSEHVKKILSSTEVLLSRIKPKPPQTNASAKTVSNVVAATLTPATPAVVASSPISQQPHLMRSCWLLSNLQVPSEIQECAEEEEMKSNLSILEYPKTKEERRGLERIDSEASSIAADRSINVSKICLDEECSILAAERSSSKNRRTRAERTLRRSLGNELGKGNFLGAVEESLC